MYILEHCLIFLLKKVVQQLVNYVFNFIIIKFKYPFFIQFIIIFNFNFNYLPILKSLLS